MDTLQEALDAERKARAEAKALVDAAKAEERDLNDEEAQTFDALVEQADAAKADAEKMREAEAKAEERKARIEANDAALKAVPKPRASKARFATAKAPGADMRAQMEAFGRAVSEGPDEMSDRELDLIAVKDVARWKDARAQGGYIVPRPIAHALLGVPMGAIPHLSTDADGGANLFDRDFRAQLLELQPDPTSILGRVTVIPTTTGLVIWPRLVQTDDNEYGGVDVTWIDEGAEKPETEAEFDQVRIPTHEVAAYTEVSHTLMRRSAIDIIGLLGRLMRSAMEDAFESAILQGTGVGMPLGIVNTAGIRRVQRQTPGETVWQDIVNTKRALMPVHRRPGVFTLHDDIGAELEGSVDVLNRPLFTTSMANGPYDLLNGYPYIETLRQPSGADGDFMFVDWSQYMLVVEQDVVIRSSEHFRFRHNLEALSVFAHVGGRYVQPRAAAMLVDSAS
jgi:HK97 family phage major capsid protein